MVIENELLVAALQYAELGYRVFPCVPGDKVPLTEHGFHDATLDPDQIERWWATHATANIGIATEGLIVIDIDGQQNPWPGAERSLDLATGPMSLTPGGGSHRLFRLPAGKSWRCSPICEGRNRRPAGSWPSCQRGAAGTSTCAWRG